MNIQYPGRPDYAGPDSGWTGYVHHNRRYEWCYSFHERLEYIDTKKPENERDTRRHCLVRLDLTEILPVNVLAKAERLQAEGYEYRRALSNGAGMSSCGIRYWALAYSTELSLSRLLQPYDATIIAEVQRLVPDAPWNDTLKVLVFRE